MKRARDLQQVRADARGLRYAQPWVAASTQRQKRKAAVVIDSEPLKARSSEMPTHGGALAGQFSAAGKAVDQPQHETEKRIEREQRRATIAFSTEVCDSAFRALCLARERSHITYALFIPKFCPRFFRTVALFAIPFKITSYLS